MRSPSVWSTYTAARTPPPSWTRRNATPATSPWAHATSRPASRSWSTNRAAPNPRCAQSTTPPSVYGVSTIPASSTTNESAIRRRRAGDGVRAAASRSAR
ncbi:hypothetical protein [Microbispora sp. CA-102843]|uniref:hypothetical protein n=1 Tax=Microbispora sp. CA-102843 TaxID=3239952 RepID=UPI003D92FBB2